MKSLECGCVATMCPLHAAAPKLRTLLREYLATAETGQYDRLADIDAKARALLETIPNGGQS